MAFLILGLAFVVVIVGGSVLVFVHDRLEAAFRGRRAGGRGRRGKRLVSRARRPAGRAPAGSRRRRRADAAGGRPTTFIPLD